MQAHFTHTLTHTYMQLHAYGKSVQTLNRA